MLTIESSHYSLIEIDGISFLVPGREVFHIALRENIARTADASSGIVGHVAVVQGELPLYVPNGRLRLLEHLPQERRFAACLRSGEYAIAIACDLIRPMALSADLLRQPLPQAMAFTHSPLKELIFDNNQLYFVTDTATLITNLSTQPVDIYEPESTSLVTAR